MLKRPVLDQCAQYITHQIESQRLQTSCPQASSQPRCTLLQFKDLPLRAPDGQHVRLYFWVAYFHQWLQVSLAAWCFVLPEGRELGRFNWSWRLNSRQQPLNHFLALWHSCRKPNPNSTIAASQWRQIRLRKVEAAERVGHQSLR